MNKVVFFLLLFIVILVHFVLLSIKSPKHIQVVDQHAKVQHITLARMAIKQEEIKTSVQKKEKKLIQKKEKIKPKKTPKKIPKKKKVIKKPKHLVKKSIQKKKKKKKEKETKQVAKEQKYIPKLNKQKVYAKKENMVTLKDKYINEIRKKIQKKLIYPKIAKRMRIEGIVYVSFTIYKNGNIGNIQVQKSNKSILKRSAVRTLKSLVMKEIPSQLGLTKLELNLPISFKIRRG